MFWKFWYWVSVRLFYNHFLGKRQWPSHFCKQMTQLVRLTSSLNFKLSVRPAKTFIEQGTSFVDIYYIQALTKLAAGKSFRLWLKLETLVNKLRNELSDSISLYIDSVKPVQIETWCSLVFDNSRRSLISIFTAMMMTKDASFEKPISSDQLKISKLIENISKIRYPSAIWNQAERNQLNEYRTKPTNYPMD